MRKRSGDAGMKNTDRMSKAELLEELTRLRRRISELEELAENGEKWRSLVDSTPAFVIVLDREGTVLYLNQSLRGVTIDKAIGLNAFDQASPDGREKLHRIVEQAFATGVVEDFTDTALLPDGRERWFDCKVRTLEKDGEVEAVAIFYTDITERKLAEKSLRESEEELSSIFRTAPIGIGMVSADRIILRANGRFFEMLGYTREELSGKSIRLIYASDEEFKRIGMLKYCRASDSDTGTLETRWRRKDGEIIDILLSFTLTNPSELSPGGTFTALDITERKRMEEELRRERDKAQGYLDIAEVILLVIDREGIVTLINRKGCEILGYGEDEILGKLWFDHFLPEYSRDEVQEIFSSIMRGELDAHGYEEHLVLCKSGAERLIAWHNTLLRDAEGNVVGTLSSGNDITERRRAARALKESEEKYRLIVETVQEGIWAIDAGAVTTFVNSPMAEMLGYEVDEMLGRDLLSFMDDEGKKLAQRMLERRRKGLRDRHDFEFIRKDGTRLYTHLQTAPVMNERGEFEGAIAFVTDKTAMRLTQMRRESLNRIFLSLGADILENVEIIVAGAKGILGCDYAAYCLLARERLSILSTAPGEDAFAVTADVEGHICYDLISGNGREPLSIENLERSAYAGSDPVISKNGFLSYLGYPVIVEGRTVGSLSIFDKKTRQWSDEEVETAGMLAQALSVEQERLDREEDLKNFIDVASHELRHPITIIKGYIQTLKSYWDRLEEFKRDEMLDAVDQGADRLNRLVKELLDVSRIERGSFPIRKEILPLRPVLEDVVSEMINRGFINRFMLPDVDESETLYADPDRIGLLLSILLDNASKYSTPGSEIGVEYEREGSFAVLAILDRGVGVPEEEREKIFERFYQVEDVLHHSMPGMGIGLYIAREITEAHGGRIWHEPRPGGGSKFHVTLPREEG
jgi:two-component system, sporulation sensor kinase E